MKKMKRENKLRRIVRQNFLLEKNLYNEVGLDQLPEQLATAYKCPSDQAFRKALSDPFLATLTQKDLDTFFVIRDMAIVSKTAATLSMELKSNDITYEHCCGMALCYAIVENFGNAFCALRAAAAKHEDWARHHFIYGLCLALNGDRERSLWELHMASKYEPYIEGQQAIQRAIDVVEGKS